MLDILLTESQVALREEVWGLVRSVPRALLLDMDADRVRYPRGFLGEAGERHLLGLRFPAEYGGLVRNLALGPNLAVWMRVGTSHHCAFVLKHLDVADELP